jgi:hypothetical protein
MLIVDLLVLTDLMRFVNAPTPPPAPVPSLGSECVREKAAAI